MLGVSRTAVREALQQLESEELIENLPNKGPQVATTTRGDAQGVYEVRGALEALVGGLFAWRASDQEVKQLAQIVRRFQTACRTGDVGRILKVKNDFYDKLLEGARSPPARTMLRMIYARANVLRSSYLSQADRSGESSAEITEILEKVEARDAAAVEDACRRHVDRAAVAALRLL